MEFMARKLLEEYEKWSLKIHLENNFYMGCGAETKDLILEDQKDYIRRCDKFKYLGVKIYKEDTQDNYTKNIINKDRAIIAMLNSVLWNRQMTRKKKLQICNPIVNSTVTNGAEIWKFKKNQESKLMSIQMNFHHKQNKLYGRILTNAISTKIQGSTSNTFLIE
jgi:hypothetical protein